MNGKSNTGLGAKDFAKMAGKLALLFVGIWILSLLPKEWGYSIATIVAILLLLHVVDDAVTRITETIERSHAIQLQQMEERLGDRIRSAAVWIRDQEEAGP